MASGGSVGAALLKFGVGVVERSTGSLIARVIHWLTGKRVLVVGQARGGKTTFRDYLRYGLLDDEKPTDKTHDVTTTGTFSIALGRDKELQLVFRSLKELPGQYGPVAHANMAFEHRPHAIIVLSDLTAPLTGEPEKAAAGWLEAFCRHLELKWRRAGRRKNRLQSMMLVLNKRDKVKEDVVEKRAKAFRKILDKELRQALGTRAPAVAILPCVSVSNPDGPKLIDGVITHLAKSLAEGL